MISFFQASQNATPNTTGWTAAEWAALIVAFIALLGVIITVIVNILRGLWDKRYEYASEILKFRIRQLEEYYAPMQLMIEKSREVYKKFKWKLKEEHIPGFDPNNFRLLDWIHRLHKENKLKPLIDEIIRIGDEMSSLIIAKGGLIEGGITDTCIKYQGHISILKAAIEGETKKDNEPGWQEFGYYPRLLNREISEGYKSIIEYMKSYLEAGDKVISKIFKEGFSVIRLFKKRDRKEYLFKERQQLLQTLRYYENYKEKYAEEFDDNDLTPLYEPFIEEINKSILHNQIKDYDHIISILDAGCGTGRDTAHFIKKGFRVTAFDASPAMVFKTKSKISSLENQYNKAASQSKCLEMTFEEMKFKNEFNGIWVAASLLHVPHSKMKKNLKNLIDALKPGGVLYLSLKYGKGSDEIGYRHFYYYTGWMIWRIRKRIKHHYRINVWLTFEKNKIILNISRWKKIFIWFNEILGLSKRQYWLNILLKKQIE